MRKLLVFSMTSLDEMIEKGNLSYTQVYTTFFNEVYFVYLYGQAKSFSNGKCHYISLGRNEPLLLALLKSPIRLYKEAKKICPTDYMTACAFYGWIYPIFLKLFMKAKIVFVPVCMPHELTKSLKRTCTGLPRIIERLLENLTFIMADKIVTSKNNSEYISWLRNEYFARKKLQIVDVLGEEYPSFSFYKTNISPKILNINNNSKPIKILHVGRLHEQKQIDHILYAMEMISKKYNIELILCGDGPSENTLRALANKLGLSNHVRFTGKVENEDLPNYYCEADLYVSCLTGTALREAALMGLPIVAYNKDFVKGLLDEHTAFLAQPDSPADLAAQICYALEHPEMYNMVSKNLLNFAKSRWGLELLPKSLEKMFEWTPKENA